MEAAKSAQASLRSFSNVVWLYFFGFFLALLSWVEGVGAQHTLNSGSVIFKVQNGGTKCGKLRESINSQMHCKKRQS